MRAAHLTPPIRLALPGGVYADYIPESDPPAYAINGEPIAVDVQIPEDLVAEGWYWHGSFLSWRAAPDSCGISIATNTYPPPGWPNDRHDCFTSARLITSIRHEHAAQRAADVAKKPTKAKKRATKVPEPKPAARPEPEPQQLELFEVAA